MQKIILIAIFALSLLAITKIDYNTNHPKTLSCPLYSSPAQCQISIDKQYPGNQYEVIYYPNSQTFQAERIK